MTQIVRRSTAIILSLFGSAFGASHAEELRITSVQPAPNQKLIVTGTTSVLNSVDLEGSSDLRNWSKLQTFPAGAAVTYTDSSTSGYSFYRLTAGTSTPVTLPDLGALVNRVFAAPENLNTVQYAPNGNLSYIAWRDQSLIVRERTSAGWTENVLNNGGNTFQMLTQFSFSGRARITHSNPRPRSFTIRNRGRTFSRRAAQA